MHKDAMKTENQTARVGATYNSVDELAAELGVSRATAYTGLREGTIPGIRLGNRFIIPRAAVSQWLRSAGGHVAA
jgi:excisionase family DNA binding protein